MSKTVLLFVLFLAHLGGREPGVLLLSSPESYCSLKKQAVWLEKYLDSSIRRQSINDFDYRFNYKSFTDNVVFLTSLFYPYKLPRKCMYKVLCAQSMLESSAIPQSWVNTLNHKVDFVTVPCAFLKRVYKSCGVKIPIFVLPMGSSIEEWLSMDVMINRTSPFVFVASGSMFQKRKNHDILIEAFLEAFGDSDDVMLRIQVRTPDFGSSDQMIEKYDLNNRDNISLHYGDLEDDEYKDFICSGNCLVNISGGEGFSITPREALAIGMPAIVTNNSAQVDICRSGFVRSVECTVPVPAVYPFGTSGVWRNPTVEAVKEALIDVYSNYEDYLELAKRARPWVERYTAKYLVPKWTTLLHPQRIELGDKNEVREDRLITNSKQFYIKYSKFMGIK